MLSENPWTNINLKNNNKNGGPKQLCPPPPTPRLAEANPEPDLLPNRRDQTSRLVRNPGAWERMRSRVSCCAGGSRAAAATTASSEAPQHSVPALAAPSDGGAFPLFRGALALCDHAAPNIGLPVAHGGWPGRGIRPPF